MTDVADGHVVVGAPEERNALEGGSFAEHAAGGGLPLLFGHHPVFDADALAGVGIGEAGDVAGGPDAGDAACGTGHPPRFRGRWRGLPFLRVSPPGGRRPP